MAASCRSSSTPPAAEKKPETTWGIYRFDDQLASATVSAPGTGSSIAMGERLIWDFKDKTVSWDLVRGRLGFKPDLVVKAKMRRPSLSRLQIRQSIGAATRALSSE